MYIGNLIFIFNHFLDYGFNLQERTKFIEDEECHDQAGVTAATEDIDPYAEAIGGHASGAVNLADVNIESGKNNIESEAIPLHFWDLITKYMQNEFSSIEFINEYISDSQL